MDTQTQINSEISNKELVQLFIKRLTSRSTQKLIKDEIEIMMNDTKKSRSDVCNASLIMAESAIERYGISHVIDHYRLMNDVIEELEDDSIEEEAERRGYTIIKSDSQFEQDMCDKFKDIIKQWKNGQTTHSEIEEMLNAKETVTTPSFNQIKLQLV